MQIGLFEKLQYKKHHSRSRTMKYKKQLRWLLFLLIPFIIMLAVLILVPLQIMNSSQSLATQTYDLGKINLGEKGIRSSNTMGSIVVENAVNKYARLLNIFEGFTLSPQDHFLTNQTIYINSGFQFNTKIRNTPEQLTLTLPQSMWFATNVTDQLQFSTAQRKIYASYLGKEMFIRSFFRSNDTPLSSISIFFSIDNQSIIFLYPTKYEENYSNLSSSTEGSIYPTILKLLQLNNYSFTSVSLIKYEPELNNSYLVICQASLTNGLIAIPCIQLGMVKIAAEFLSTENFLTKTYLLISSNQQNQSPLVAFEFQNGSLIETPPNYSLNFSNNGFTKQQFYSSPLSDANKLAMKRSDFFTQFLSSIQLFDDPGSRILMNIFTEHEIKLSNFQSTDLKQNLTILIIPIVILLVLGLILSTFLLKFLLDSIDKQLFALEKCCKFIVDGDINIKIHEYKGTKDIKNVYDQVRIINKLHRYSTNSYFTGHFAEKLLKYNEALQFLNSLGYDTGNILENMGEAYTHIQQWHKSINSYKQSVGLGLRQLKNRFNLSMELVLKHKKERIPLPHGYKELQIVLIRRMFKLNFTHIKYIEMRSTFTKVDKAESSNEEAEFQKRMDRLVKQSTQNLSMLKIAFYPDFSSYSECLFSLYSESKQLANLKNFEQAKRIFKVAYEFNEIYTEEYSETTKMMRQKGSKFKQFHQRNKLTAHSRANPDLLKIVRNMFMAKIVGASESSADKYNEILSLLIESVKTGVTSMAICYIVTFQLRKLLVGLKIDPSKYESTQIFRQAVPFKTLYYGEITKEVEPLLYKFPTKHSLGLEREFVFVVDCARNPSKNQENLSQFFRERATYIFDKLIKNTDRLSIVKFNIKNGIKIECNLTLKQSNEVMLKKEIQSIFKEQNQAKGSFEEMVEMLCRTVKRIKGLQCEKIIVMFFKTIAFYAQIIERKQRKKKSDVYINSNQRREEMDENKSEYFGEYIIQMLRIEHLRNCKLILLCSHQDSMEAFRSFFGLEDINRRIWGACNQKNNVVYVVEDKHKSDLDRILMLKTQDVPDNHVFIL